jgi:hypothetical protein
VTSSAQATIDLAGHFAESGEGDGQFNTARAIAVNETGSGSGASAGDLYVLDGGYEQRINQFEENGDFVRTFGWGVQDGSDEFQICTSGCHGAVFPSSEGAAGSITFATGIAVDQTTGNVYVADNQVSRVDVFGSDGTFQGAFGYGVETGTNSLQFCTTTCHAGVRGGAAGQFEQPSYVAVDPTTGNIYVTDAGTHRVDEFSLTLNGSEEVTAATFVLAFGWGVDTGANAFESCTAASTCGAGETGSSVGEFAAGQPNSVAVNSAGVVYTAEDSFAGRVQSFTPAGGTSYTPAVFAPAAFSDSGYYGPRHVAVGAGDHVFATRQFPAGADTCPNGSPSRQEYRVVEVDSAGALQGPHTALTCAGASTYFGLAANKATGNLYIPSSEYEEPRFFGIRILGSSDFPSATIDSIEPNTSGAVVHGRINPNGPATAFPNPVTTSYELEYKLTTASSWTPFGSPLDVGAGTSDVPVTVHLGGLQGNTPYEIRLRAFKPRGSLNTYGPQQTFTTDPVPPSIESFTTTGVTATSADLRGLINPHGDVTSYHFEYGTTPEYGHQTPETEIGNALTPVPILTHIENLEGVVYHFRLVAHNSIGTTISRDQTFTFFPPPCPNATLRQQTGSAYLPDCRAYELVSPSDTGNVVLTNGITFPSPYAVDPPRFGFHGKWGAVSGFDTPNNSFDSYVATRTSTGWVTKYVGVHGSENLSATLLVPNLTWTKFMDFEGGFFSREVPIARIWNPEGIELGRWPADYQSIPGAKEREGATQPSPDFTHLAFSSNNVDFDPQELGITSAPGSAYDYDTEAQSTDLISKTANGEDIHQEPGNTATTHEYIVFPGPTYFSFRPGETAEINPGVSTNGSHILMSTAAEPDNPFDSAIPLNRLYMRVGDAITYEVSRGADVRYVGMTRNGSRVFFTTSESLVPADTDTSTDLYMWSEEGDTLTDVSLGSEGSGNTDSCFAPWTARCGVQTVANPGSYETDNSIAADSGDIYFYSPELLDGPENGLDGAQNLYVYRNGQVEFVTQLNTDGQNPVTRMQVSPSGDHAAFITASSLTSYDNAGFEEMYSYEPSTKELICVSCNPDGEPPQHDVEGSMNGLFMANDGRTFWTTIDPLVVQDTDGIKDVYEYVEGRPQLITAGTGAQDERGGSQAGVPAGLSGVTADGVNLYFSTYDTLVEQDHNGPFLKFYDARIGGGFPPAPKVTPCVAADECHGAASSTPPPASIVSTGDLGSDGNHKSAGAAPGRHKRHKRHERHRTHRNAHRSKNAHRGGRR